MTLTRRFDVIAIGDLNIDLILGIEELPEFGREILARSLSRHAGGVAANFAAYCARLGLQTALVARVGRDDFGSFLIAQMAAAGVCTDFIRRDDTLATGVTVSLSGPQDRAFVTHLGTIDSLTGADVPDNLLADTRWMHAGSYFLQSRLQPDLPDICRRAQTAGVTVSLDTGYDPHEKWNSGLHDVLPLVDLFLPNEVEVTSIGGSADPLQSAWALAKAGPHVALKLGGQGSWFIGGKQALMAPPPTVRVADTTCCGDAFNAGFIAAWLQGYTPKDCLHWGNAMGALVAASPGNAAETVSPEALQRVLQSGSVGKP